MIFSATIDAASPERPALSLSASDTPFAMSPEIDPGRTWPKNRPIHVYFNAVRYDKLGARTFHLHAENATTTGTSAYHNRTRNGSACLRMCTTGARWTFARTRTSSASESS